MFINEMCISCMRLEGKKSSVRGVWAECRDIEEVEAPTTWKSMSDNIAKARNLAKSV